MYYDNNETGYHKIGEFYTHLLSDLEGVVDALRAGGYEVCRTLDGDMLIMKPGDYDDEFMHEFLHGDDDDDDDTPPPFGNIRHFPKEY